MEMTAEELRIISRYLKCAAECREDPERPEQLRVHLGPGNSASLSIEGARRILAEIQSGRLSLEV